MRACHVDGKAHRVEPARHAHRERRVCLVRVAVLATDAGERVLSAPRAGAEVTHLREPAPQRRLPHRGRELGLPVRVREQQLAQPQRRHLVRHQRPLALEAIATRRRPAQRIFRLEAHQFPRQRERLLVFFEPRSRVAPVPGRHAPTEHQQRHQQAQPSSCVHGGQRAAPGGTRPAAGDERSNRGPAGRQAV